ncbi:MAG: sugar phosphate isomerase/epimerase [Oscillospiraceae bacterium]|nr:sugar phosphate isomerase/epimerase [Oscillospiraceae bacterium]
MDFALQLWSINEELEMDFYGTFEKVAKMGYAGVEFAGYGGKSAKELKSKLDEYGLSVAGSHVPLDRLKNSLQEEIEYNLEIGNKFLVCPRAEFSRRDDVYELIDILNNAASEAKKHGLILAYHNHAREFEKIDGEYILDLLIKHVPDLALEIDVFWVKYAGLDPVKYIKQCGDRASLVHLKQINGDKKNVDFSDGVIDMFEIISASKYAKHFIVEQEKATSAPMLSAKRNLEWMIEDILKKDN